jgi:hypothetical protein
MMTTINRRWIMKKFLYVSELARRWHCRPRDISDLFYQRIVSDERCPVVGGRRLIPADMVPEIEAALRHRLGDANDQEVTR